MMTLPISAFEHLTSLELIALLFLVEEGQRGLQLDLEKWRVTKSYYQRQIQNYPNQEEEKHYLSATLESVYDLDPYSGKTVELIGEVKPLIERLIQN